MRGIQKVQPFEYQTPKSPNFECFMNLNVGYSDRDFSRVATLVNLKPEKFKWGSEKQTSSLFRSWIFV